MRLRPALVIAIASLLAAMVLAVAVYFWSRPAVLQVAVGPDDRGHAQLMAAFAQKLNTDRAPVRLRLVRKSNLDEAAQALDAKEVDLAVVRSDHMPRDGQTLAILHRAPVIFIVPAGSPIRKTSQLAGKRIGVAYSAADNQRVVDAVLGAPGKAQAVFASPGDLPEHLLHGKIDAVMLVSPLQGDAPKRILAALSGAGKGIPVIFGVNDAEAFAKRNPVFESTEIPRGTYVPAPARPAEDMTTASVTQRLVARSTVSDTDAADLTRLLFMKRSALAAQAPLASTIESLDPDDAANAGLHPGARAYYAGEQRTFIERYGDWAYIGMAIVGMLASGIGGLYTYFAGRRQMAAAQFVHRLQALLARVRDCHAIPQLHGLQQEADRMLEQALTRLHRGEMNGEQFTIYAIVNQNLHLAIQQREWQLTGSGPCGNAGAGRQSPAA